MKLKGESGVTKPGDCPLRSERSRAAARFQAGLRRQAEGEGILFRLRLIGSPSDPNKECTCPAPAAGTFALCRCFE